MEASSAWVTVAGRALTGIRRGLVRSLPLALLVLAACRSTSLEPTPEPPPVGPSHPPGWIDAPVTWAKLDAIEAWLDSPSSHRDDHLRIEAWLQLSEGRLEFSSQDLDGSNTPTETLRLRIQAAKEGFERVLAEPLLAGAQRARAVLGRQRSLALISVPPRRSGLPLIRRSTWGALPAVPSRMNPLRGVWSRVTVHHSADSRSVTSGGTYQESSRLVRSIQKYHLEDPALRWGDLGYHFAIDSAGRIFEGRELAWQGAHAGGANNHQNIGVCLLGSFESPAARPTPAALKSLELLLDHLRVEYRISATRVFTHRDFKETACPGPALTSWVRAYRQRR